MEVKIKRFINELAMATQFDNVFNQYSMNVTENAVRRDNLLLYLNNMSEMNLKVLFVGEAPGYHGCRLTGIPFTSEYILIKDNIVFGKKRGYRKTTEVDRLKKEQTATIIWNTLNTYNFAPLMWNAFPFHPHEKGDSTKNRTPLKEELEYGQVFLESIIDLFEIDNVIAIGKKAEASLRKLGISCKEIRHPSKGGKPEFERGIREILSGRQYCI